MAVVKVAKRDVTAVRSLAIEIKHMLSTLSEDVQDTIFLPIDLGVRYLFPLALCFNAPAGVYLLAFRDKTLVLLMV